MSDYNVTIKVRNNRLLQAIKAAGHEPGQKLAQAAGVTYGSLNDLISMKISAVKQNGDLREVVEKLCVFLHKMPCELFTEEQLYEGFENNTAEILLSSEEARQLASPKSYSLEDSEVVSLVDKHLSKLPPRMRGVLIDRFGIEGDVRMLHEIGEDTSIGAQAVRAVESKALHKLRRAMAADKTAIELIEHSDTAKAYISGGNLNYWLEAWVAGKPIPYDLKQKFEGWYRRWEADMQSY